MSTVISWFEHPLALPFFGIRMKTDLFQSCGHCWVFQICWHIECSTLTASSFRIWNSSTGIPSPPLALFVVMLPKVHFTLHFRMWGSRWMTTPSWFSRSLRPFLYSSSVYSCHLFLISSASDRSLQFLFFIMPILAWNAPLISPIFLKRSLVFTTIFPPLFLCIVHLRRSYLSLLVSGTLYSVGCIFPFFPCLSYFFFLQLFVKPPQTNALPSCISLPLKWFWLLPLVHCSELQFIVQSTVQSIVYEPIQITFLKYCNYRDEKQIGDFKAIGLQK